MIIDYEYDVQDAICFKRPEFIYNGNNEDYEYLKNIEDQYFIDFMKSQSNKDNEFFWKFKSDLFLKVRFYSDEDFLLSENKYVYNLWMFAHYENNDNNTYEYFIDCDEEFELRDGNLIYVSECCDCVFLPPRVKKYYKSSMYDDMLYGKHMDLSEIVEIVRYNGGFIELDKKEIESVLKPNLNKVTKRGRL